ncbi:MAG: hypothetical protein ACFFBV_03985 [Promethearchaeota archaeon]
MVYNIITLPVTILFVICGGGLFYYAIELRKKYPEQHNFLNSILTFVLWILAGLIYPIFFWTENTDFGLFQVLSTFFICIFTPGLIFLILYYQFQFVVKRKPDIKEKRNIEAFLKRFDEKNNGITSERKQILKTDLHRKALHLFPAGIIILLWIFSVYIWDGIGNADNIWGITGEEFGKFLILTAGYSGILIFGALDYIRLSYIFESRNFFHLIPDNVLNLLGKSMKRKENYEFIKPTILVLSFAPIFFFPFGVFAAASLIATIGDGAASVFGLRFGKIYFPKSSDKTVVGYIAGFLASFGISILMLLIFESTLNFSKIIIIASSGAIVFFIIDFLNLKIDDNILNPIFCALIMGCLYYLL